MNKSMLYGAAFLVGATFSSTPGAADKKLDWVEKSVNVRCMPPKEYYNFLVEVGQRPLMSGKSEDQIYLVSFSDETEMMIISVIFKNDVGGAVCQIAGVGNVEIHKSK